MSSDFSTYCAYSIIIIVFAEVELDVELMLPNLVLPTILSTLDT